MFHDGYALVKLRGHHRADRKGYVRRCILVAEQKLGRVLIRGEVVHHINQDRADDRPENLQVLPNQGEHIRGHNRHIKRQKKLTEGQVREMCALFGKMPVYHIAKRFAVGDQTVWDIWRRMYWRHVTDDIEMPPAPPVRSRAKAA